MKREHSGDHGPVCDICLKPLEKEARYHPSCLRKLFGTGEEPSVPFRLDEVSVEAQKSAGKLSISGVQPKLSMRRIGRRLISVATGGRYILKPQTQAFLHIPENEHTFMRLAGAMGIETPPNGLVRLKDGSFAFIVKRFDRTAMGEKLRCEDFAQILGLDKYGGSAESIGRRLVDVSDAPGLDAQFFFERLLFFFLIGNGDAHLKNYSMLEGRRGELTRVSHQDSKRNGEASRYSKESDRGRHRRSLCTTSKTADRAFRSEDREDPPLQPDAGETSGLRFSPAYDIVCSKLVIPREEDSAIPVNGKKNRLTRKDFQGLAAHLQIRKGPLENILQRFEAGLDRFLETIEVSRMTPQEKERSREICLERHRRLFG